MVLGPHEMQGRGARVVKETEWGVVPENASLSGGKQGLKGVGRLNGCFWTPHPCI